MKQEYQEPKTTLREFRDIRLDYVFDASIFNEEPERIRRVKELVEKLPTADRVMLLMYADCGSLRKVARKLGVSHMTMSKEIRRIRASIIEKL